MRFVIQRVMHSKVTINGEVRGQIGKGFMVLIGVGEEDTVEIADKMIHKMVNMRIFEDENGKTNLGLKEVGGSLLLISQFTLYADCKRGVRIFQHWNQKHEKNGGGECWLLCRFFREPLSDCPQKI